MLQVRNLNEKFNREGHLVEMRGQQEKVKKYAQDKFGYRPNYIKTREKPSFKSFENNRLATTVPVKHQKLLLAPQLTNRLSHQNDQFMEFSTLKSPINKLLHRRGKLNPLAINSLQAEMAVGPDTPGSLKMGMQPTIGINYLSLGKEDSEES
jgi:hypothetical protein